MSQQGYDNQEQVSSTEGTVVALTYTDGGTPTAYYDAGTGVRLYAGGKMTVTANDWNTQANGEGTAYAADATFTITGNTTLYAQWAINSYNVTLPVDDEYGTYTMDAENPVAYGTEVTLAYTPATSR